LSDQILEMDRVGTSPKKSSSVYRWLVLGAVVAFVLGVALPMGPHVLRQGKFVAGVAAGKHFSNRGLMAQIAQEYIDAWDSLQAKMDGLQSSEEENNKLRLELARTRHQLEAVKFEKRARSVASVTQELKTTLKSKTGTVAGRTLAGISYKPPGSLLPSQLHTLGVSYFKGRDNERAVVIFSHLIDLEDNATYKTPRMHLMTGLAWYRLENYLAADESFDQVLKMERKPDDERYHAQARLWKALVAKKLHKEVKVQYWLKDLLDNHPRAQETEWINPIEGGRRAIASKPKAHGHAEEEPVAAATKEEEHGEEHGKAHGEAHEEQAH